MDPWRAAEAASPTAADLATRSASRQTGTQRQGGTRCEGSSQLEGWVEAASQDAPRRGRHRNHLAAQHDIGCEPWTRSAIRPRDRQQAAVLQRGRQRPGDAVMGSRRPGAIDSRRAGAEQRVGRVKALIARRAEDRTRLARSRARRAERRRQSERDRTESPMPRSCSLPAQPCSAGCHKRSGLRYATGNSRRQHRPGRNVGAVDEDRVADQAPSPSRQPSPTIAGPSMRTPAPSSTPSPRQRRTSPRPVKGLAARTPSATSGGRDLDLDERRSARRGFPDAARRDCRCRSSRRRSHASRRGRRHRSGPGRRPSPSRRTRLVLGPRRLARPRRGKEIEDLRPEHVDAGIGQVRQRLRAGRASPGTPGCARPRRRSRRRTGRCRRPVSWQASRPRHGDSWNSRIALRSMSVSASPEIDQEGVAEKAGDVSNPAGGAEQRLLVAVGE